MWNELKDDGRTVDDMRQRAITVRHQHYMSCVQRDARRRQLKQSKRPVDMIDYAINALADIEGYGSGHDMNLVNTAIDKLNELRNQLEVQQ